MLFCQTARISFRKTKQGSEKIFTVLVGNAENILYPRFTVGIAENEINLILYTDYCIDVA